MNDAMERSPLLRGQDVECTTSQEHRKTKRQLASVFVAVFVAAIVTFAVILGDGLPSDPEKAAITILERSPVIVSLKLLFEVDSSFSRMDILVLIQL